MDQLELYLAEQRARRVSELEWQNSELRERLQDSGEALPGDRSEDRVPPSRGSRGSLRQRLDEAEARIRELEHDLESVLESRSWRVLRLLGIAKR